MIGHYAFASRRDAAPFDAASRAAAASAAQLLIFRWLSATR